MWLILSSAVIWTGGYCCGCCRLITSGYHQPLSWREGAYEMSSTGDGKQGEKDWRHNEMLCLQVARTWRRRIASSLAEEDYSVNWLRRTQAITAPEGLQPKSHPLTQLSWLLTTLLKFTHWWYHQYVKLKTWGWLTHMKIILQWGPVSRFLLDSDS